MDALSASDVWAVGQSGNGPGEVPLALHFDGTRWIQRTVPPPSDGTHQVFSAVSGASGSDVWALGSTFGGPAHPVLYHWDGSAWAPQAFPVPAPARSPGSPPCPATACGPRATLPSGSGHRQTLIMHFDGSGWSQVQQVPNPGGSGFDNSLTGMAARQPATSGHRAGTRRGAAAWSCRSCCTMTAVRGPRRSCPAPGGGDDNIIGAVAVSSPGQAWVAGAFLDNSQTYAAPVPVVPFVTGLSPFSAAYTLRFYGLAGRRGRRRTRPTARRLDAGQIVGSDLARGLREPFGTPVCLTVCDVPAW